jgi:plastocyanin
MRFVRLSAVLVAAVLLLVLATATIAAATPSSQHPGKKKGASYTVWVGAEQARRSVDLMAFFPATIRVHVGDTVRFLQNSNEIHTVTFLGGRALPEFVVPAASLNLPATPSPLVFNPLATARTQSPVKLGDQTTWANSGVMGREAGQYRRFTVTFTAAGSYHYVCVVHGTMMSGTVDVVGGGERVPSPMKDKAIARHQVAKLMAKAPAVFRAARHAQEPATRNQDGTWTHHVLLGYDKGQIGLMRFFPAMVRVHPRDTVVWTMGAHSMAPHTVTFLNGGPEPGLVVPVAQQSGPPVLYINPEVLFPSKPAGTLLRTGYYNSGLLQPVPGTSYSLAVGDVKAGPLRYLCQLHDTSGMKGTLVVLP